MNGLRRRSLGTLLALCMLLSLLPSAALAGEAGGTITISNLEGDATDYTGLVTSSDYDVTLTFKNSARKDSLPWEKAAFQHNGNDVWQSVGGTGDKYYSLAMLVSGQCYLVYDYALASTPNTSSLYHKTASAITSTSGSATYSQIPTKEGTDFKSEEEVNGAEWKTAVIDLTNVNTAYRTLWLEHYMVSRDENPLKHAYISNIRIYGSADNSSAVIDTLIDTLPSEYKATIDVQFEPKHGYAEIQYSNSKHKYTLEVPKRITVPLFSQPTIYFRKNDDTSLKGWVLTDSENNILQKTESDSLPRALNMPLIVGPEAYLATAVSTLYAPTPDMMELYSWDKELNTWTLMGEDVADYEGYWWSQTYDEDIDLKWKIVVTKGAAEYESYSVTDNGAPVLLNEGDSYEVTPGNEQHVLEFSFHKTDCADLVRTVLLWPTISFEQATNGEGLSFWTPDPVESYLHNGNSWQFSPVHSTPERTVFSTTCSDYLSSSNMNIIADQTGILSFDYMVDGTEENALTIEIDGGQKLVSVEGKVGWTRKETPLKRGEKLILGYTIWDEQVGDSYAAISNIAFLTGTVNIDLTLTGGGTVTGFQAGANSVEIGSTVTLEAVPEGGNQFMGWLDENNDLMSMENTYTFVVREGKKLTALFADPGQAVAQAGLELYDDLPSAFGALAATGGGTVRLIRDYALPETVTVPSGITFLVPASNVDTGYNSITGYNPDGTETKYSTGISPDAKRCYTLTIPEGKRLDVEGTVLVNAVTGRPAAGHYDMDVTGGYAEINLAGEIRVSDGGVLDVCGYVKGSGTVTALPGGEVRDLYVVRNWRGGSQAFEVFPDVYPMNQVDMHNIMATTVIESGGTLTGTVKMYASGSYYYTHFPQVDSLNGLIRLKEGGRVVKTYDGATDREKLVLSGGGSMESSTLEIVGMDLSTAGFIYPIDGDMDFELVSGEWTVNERLKFMPGATVTVADGVSLTIAEKAAKTGEVNQVVFYDSFQPEDPANTSTTAYPKARGAAVLTLQGGAALNVNGAFAGTIAVADTASTDKPAIISIAENGKTQASTLEANGYCNGTRELIFDAKLDNLLLAAGENYKCWYDDSVLVVKDSADQAFEAACARLDAIVYTETTTTGEVALADYVKGLAETAVNNTSYTVSVTKVAYTAPVAGTAQAPAGTDGSYHFTVTLAEEGRVYTTAEHSITVLAAPYTAEQAFAEARARLDEAVYAPTSITDETALAEYVKGIAAAAVNNDLYTASVSIAPKSYTAPMAGTEETPAGTAGSYTFTVTLVKDEFTHTTEVLNVTVSADVFDPVKAFAEVCTRLDGAVYEDTALTDEAALADYVKGFAETAVNNTSYTVSVTKVAYVAPEAGTAQAPDGVDGSYVFTVTLTKGDLTHTTQEHSIVVLAAPYTAADAFEAAWARLIEAEYAPTSITGEAPLADYVKGLAETAVNNASYTVSVAKVVYTSPEAGTEQEPAGTDGSYTFRVTLAKGALTRTTEEFNIAVLAAPYNAEQAFNEACDRLNSATYGGTSASDENALAEYVKSVAETAVNDASYTVSVTEVDYTTPETGTEEVPDGVSGSYTFTVTLTKNEFTYTTEERSVTVRAEPYDAEQAFNEASDRLDAAVYGDTATTEEAALADYVKGLAAAAVDDATYVVSVEQEGYTVPEAGTEEAPAGVNGRYIFTVTLTKDEFSYTTEELSITVLATPYDAAPAFAEARARLDAAVYGDTSTTDETALEDYVKGLAAAAVEDVSYAVTVARVSYTAPVTGTAQTPAGVNGSYTFTVTLAKGELTYTTPTRSVIILAAPYSRPSGGGGGGASTPDKETHTNPDGSVTTTVTDPKTGTVTETTKAHDGTETVVEKLKDGTITETVKTTDGTRGTTTLTAEGEVRAEVKVSEKAVETATKSSEMISLPVAPVKSTGTSAAAPVVEVSLPVTATPVKVELPVEQAKAGTVLVLVKEDGTEEILCGTVLTENGVAVTLEGSATLKVLDNSKAFDDVAPVESWAGDAITFVTARELFNGTSETEFAPTAEMSRAMLVTVLHRLKDEPAGSADLDAFADGGVVPDWSAEAMAWGVESGLITGDGTGLQPSATISREQLVTILYRSVGSPACTDTEMDDFVDAAQISSWAQDAMEWAIELGLLSGRDGNRLDSGAPATRAEVSAVIMRFINGR